MSVMNQVSRHMRRCAARFPHDCDDVLKGLADLRNEVLALELLLGVPADLAGDENEASRRDYPVGITFGLLPVPRIKKLKVLVLSVHSPRPATVAPAPGRSRNRWIFPVSVFGSASVNLTDRGYL